MNLIDCILLSMKATWKDCPFHNEHLYKCTNLVQINDCSIVTSCISSPLVWCDETIVLQWVPRLTWSYTMYTCLSVLCFVFTFQPKFDTFMMSVNALTSIHLLIRVYFQRSTCVGSAWSFGVLIRSTMTNDLRLRRISIPATRELEVPFL